jgi:MerR family transcriptional regulator, light-induced transcriptional regulator
MVSYDATDKGNEMYSTTPAFNLKVVLKETGLAADTLRAWERRYGLPVPNRTAGGHRLYSQRDIETIKWLVKRQSEGLSISRAVDLWNEQTTSGSDPLAQSAQLVPSTLIQPRTPNTTIDSLRAQWIQACLEFSESAADEVLNQAFSMFPVEMVCRDVLQQGLSEIGERWYLNSASVQQEHFASGLAMRRLDALLSATPSPTRRQTVLVGCPPEEWHTFTPLLLALLLRRRGLNVVYLGANVPADQFASSVKVMNAELVILIAQQLNTAATLQRTALELSDKEIPVAFGGRIFNIHPDLAKSISGFFLGAHLPDAVENIEASLRRKWKPNEPAAPSRSYVDAHRAFLANQWMIEMTFEQLLDSRTRSLEHIKTRMHFLSENIAAALQLGDISHVTSEIEWLKGLLHTHIGESAPLTYFLETYAQAVNQTMNSRGKFISEWLDKELEKLHSAS